MPSIALHRRNLIAHPAQAMLLLVALSLSIIVDPSIAHRRSHGRLGSPVLQSHANAEAPSPDVHNLVQTGAQHLKNPRVRPLARLQRRLNRNLLRRSPATVATEGEEEVASASNATQMFVLRSNRTRDGQPIEWGAIGCSRAQAVAWLRYERTSAAAADGSGDGESEAEAEAEAEAVGAAEGTAEVEAEIEARLEEESLVVGQRETTARLRHLWGEGRLLLCGLHLSDVADPSGLSRLQLGNLEPKARAAAAARVFSRELKAQARRTQRLSPSRAERAALLALVDESGVDRTPLLSRGKNVHPDEVILAWRALLTWFKAEFPYNRGACCPGGESSELLGNVRATREERRFQAQRTELQHCASCGRVARFARYNDLRQILATRDGRCGEYASLVYALARALGWRARLVVDWTDHMWVEVLLPTETRRRVAIPSRRRRRWQERLSAARQVAAGGSDRREAAAAEVDVSQASGAGGGAGAERRKPRKAVRQTDAEGRRERRKERRREAVEARLVRRHAQLRCAPRSVPCESATRSVRPPASACRPRRPGTVEHAVTSSGCASKSVRQPPTAVCNRLRRWVPLDPCEAAVDEPRIYADWGKEHTYILALGNGEIVDVTAHYAADWNATLARRELSEQQLRRAMRWVRFSSGGI